MNILLCVLCFVLGMGACTKQIEGEKAIPQDSSGSIDIPPVEGIRMKDVLGINGFEWEFLVNNEIDPVRTNLIKPFGGFRHYLDWGRIENEEGEYAFSPTLSGNWDYDAIYAWCQQNDVTVLACVKTVPGWFLDKNYPSDLHDAENVPAAYNADRTDPASYIQLAKIGFQFAARYGKNKNIDADLVSVVPKPSWRPNQKKIGLGLVDYIECNNEPDRWWKGPKAQQTPEEYAANLSAFYDGHKGKLGRDVGVKNADPTMQVVMGGIAKPDVNFVLQMVEWCKKHRGYRQDGSVDLCFDVINYHHYSNNKQSDWSAPGIRGEAPEVSDSPAYASAFVKMAKEHLNGMQVWVTELGYDVNSNSPQRAMAIQDKSALVTQADWSIRSALMYARSGVSRIHFYMLNDVDTQSPVQYASSGFATPEGRKRPALNYVTQIRDLMGDFVYTKTLNNDPFVDLYTLGDNKIYVLTVPDEKGRQERFELDLSDEKVSQVKIHELQPASSQLSTRTEAVQGGKLVITVSETPIFVEL
ncbi:hypothetical protein JHJ32_04340 [Parapedobacter sp. ISTM3]|uniref:hypothetical protein n=1 Tax=Parapedobacter sp. ISTM3 TaxID=2800130 RepID=UPI0019046E94|nr:hypothetical protein [Parapedobacter sp. ISTM3]MBK1439207.1 hypothetical protein [Parapedobacter sp. ISTM3]